MTSVSDWVKAAEKKQKEIEQNYINSNQYVLDTINNQKQAALDQLNASNQIAINQLNQNKEVAAQTAADNAKQANINRLLALRDNQKSLNRAGLGSQGIVGSQVNSINNSYGRNLNDILAQKASAIQDLDSQIGDTNLQYNTNVANTSAEYDANVAAARAQLEESARQAGLQAYQDVYAAQQQAWENAMAEKQYQESVRQYNENLAFQKKVQQQENSRAWASINSSKNNYNFTNNVQQIKTKYYSGDINPDTKYGTFKTTDNNGVAYQPNNIGGVKLKSTGKTAGEVYGKNATNSSGVNIANQKVWSIGDNWYIWNGSKNTYEQVPKK